MSRLEILRRAMLPLDGTIADWVPEIMDAYARMLARIKVHRRQRKAKQDRPVKPTPQCLCFPR